MTTESSGADHPGDDVAQDVAQGQVPNTQSGAGLGAGEPTTFEPEEDPEAVDDPR